MTEQFDFPLSVLYLFQTYSSPEEYESATKQPAPAFDPSKPIKRWFDPAARLPGAKPRFVYERVFYGDSGEFVPLVLTREEAATVNIPPNVTNYPGSTNPEIPVPCMDPGPDRELVMKFPGVWVVRDKRAYQRYVESLGFSESDRRLLKAIAAALGVKVS